MKVSIAMATFNGAQYIYEQLASFLSQSRLPDEVIICDDCSTDTTVDIVNEFIKIAKFDVILRVNEHNLGFVKNFEKAISLCSGDYILLSDQDDIWRNDKIQLLLDNIGSFSLIHSDASIINSSGNFVAGSFSKYANKELCSDFQFLLLQNNVTGCTVMFNSKIRDKFLPINSSFDAHDWWIAIHASCLRGITYLDIPLVCYRQHAENQFGANHFDGYRFGSFLYRDQLYLKAFRRLGVLKNTAFFLSHGFDIINDLHVYYNEYFNKLIRFESLLIHVKYWKYFQYKRSFMVKVFALIFSLFGRPGHKLVDIFGNFYDK